MGASRAHAGGEPAKVKEVLRIKNDKTKFLQI
jgi:hypothetical protein